MIYIGALISIQFIALTAYWLFKKYHAQAVLLFSGLAMLTLALILGFDIPELKNATGLKEFDLFKVIQVPLSGSIASDPYRTTSVYLYPLGHGFGVIVSSIHLPRTGKPRSQ